MKIKIFCFLIAAFTFYLLLFAFNAHAKEITVLFTGETHAMLYPCSCPVEADGGLARRSSLVKELRKNNPNTLLLDSGAFFAGGLLDEYTQNTDLDKQRTLVNLKALELMKYDALAIGDDEFNFGRDFLLEAVNKTNLPFLSCNIKADKVLPYIIKEISGVKIAVIGLTSLSAEQKAGGIKFIEPKASVKEAVSGLRNNKADIIILLSHQGESEDLKLLEEVNGIDIVITGHSRTSEELFTKAGPALIVRPEWQGRRLGKLSLTVEGGKITDYKAEELRLSDKIQDDSSVVAILPRCFSDKECKKGPLGGSCESAGTMKANCKFTEPKKVNLTVIAPRQGLCRVCDTKTTFERLEKTFPGLVASYLYYPDPKAKKLMSELGIEGLPAYILGNEAEKEEAFNRLKDKVEAKGSFFVLKPAFGGLSYFPYREKKEGRLDLFISLFNKDTATLLERIEEFTPHIHFLATEDEKGFDAAKGRLELEECLRAVCMQKYYPQVFLNYISCRANNINSSWWEDCASPFDTEKIKSCAQGSEGEELLRENISMNKQIHAMFGPVYLLGNQEIFSSQGVPSKEELREKIIKR